MTLATKILGLFFLVWGFIGVFQVDGWAGQDNAHIYLGVIVLSVIAGIILLFKKQQ